MSYNPYLNSAYGQAFNNPYMQQQQFQSYQPQPQTQLQQMEVVRVNGKNGAEAFQLAPNSSVLLLDETSPIVWLKTTDGAGYPTLSPYKITPYQAEQSIDTKSLEARISKLEEELENVKSDTQQNRFKSNSVSDKSNKGSHEQSSVKANA